MGVLIDNLHEALGESLVIMPEALGESLQLICQRLYGSLYR